MGRRLPRRALHPARKPRRGRRAARPADPVPRGRARGGGRARLRSRGPTRHPRLLPRHPDPHHRHQCRLSRPDAADEARRDGALQRHQPHRREHDAALARLRAAGMVRRRPPSGDRAERHLAARIRGAPARRQLLGPWPPDAQDRRTCLGRDGHAHPGRGGRRAGSALRIRRRRPARGPAGAAFHRFGADALQPVDARRDDGHGR